MYHTDFGSLTQLKTFKLLRTNLKLFVNFYTLETFSCHFRQAANLEKFLCNKIEIVNREMFMPHDL